MFRGIAAFPLIMGLISGFPVGAKIVCDLYENNSCTKNEAERMLIFTNNSGPLFIVGTVGYAFYSNSTIGIILLITHILSTLTVGIISSFIFSEKNFSNNEHNKNTFIKKNSDISINELGAILGSSIISGIKSIMLIGGFITIFSVIISILNNTHILLCLSNFIHIFLPIDTKLISGFITGIIEFTNGLSIISKVLIKNLNLKLTLSAFILGFGGISVTLQVLSIISKSKLSIKKYVLGKILHGIVAAIYTFILFSLPMFNLNL